MALVKLTVLLCREVFEQTKGLRESNFQLCSEDCNIVRKSYIFVTVTEKILKKQFQAMILIISLQKGLKKGILEPRI